MSNRKALMLVLSVLLISGCGSVLFYDDFENGSVGDQPNMIPPGEPVGDMIYMSTTTGSSLRLIAGPSSGGSAAGGQWVSYRKSESDPTLRFVGFMSKEITAGERAFTATWSGRASLSDADGPLDVYLGSAHFGRICGFRVEGGRVLWDEDGNYSDVGAFPNGGVHSVVWTVDRNAQTCVLAINGGGASVSTGARAVTGTGLTFLTAARPTLWLQFSEGGIGSSTYALNDVRISETDPES